MTKSFFYLMLALFLSSCVKEKSTSEHDFAIDTVFTTNLGMQKFYVNFSRENKAETSGGFVYLAISEEIAVSDYRLKVVKLNLATGEIAWSFDQFKPDDKGNPQKFNLKNGRLLIQTLKNAYVLDAGQGTSVFTFNPEDSVNFRSAALGPNELFVSFYIHDKGTWLQKIDLQTGVPQTLKHLPLSQDFYHIPVNIHSIRHQHRDYVFWQVYNRVGVNPPVSFLYAYAPGFQNFEYLSLGTGAGNNPFDTWIVSDSLSENFITVADNGLIQAHSLGRPQPLQWIHKSPWFDKFFYNSTSIYLGISDSRTADIFVKQQTGEIREIPLPGLLKAVSDDMLLSTNGPVLNISDPQTGALLKEVNYSSSTSVHQMFHVGGNEFVYAGFVNASQAEIGCIRITAVQP